MRAIHIRHFSSSFLADQNTRINIRRNNAYVENDSTLKLEYEMSTSINFVEITETQL